MSLINVSSKGQNPADFIAKFPMSLSIEPHSKIALKTGNCSFLEQSTYLVTEANNTGMVAFGTGWSKDTGLPLCQPFTFELKRNTYTSPVQNESALLQTGAPNFLDELQRAINDANPNPWIATVCETDGITNRGEYKIKWGFRTLGHADAPEGMRLGIVKNLGLYPQASTVIDNTNPAYSTITNGGTALDKGLVVSGVPLLTLAPTANATYWAMIEIEGATTNAVHHTQFCICNESLLDPKADKYVKLPGGDLQGNTVITLRGGKINIKNSTGFHQYVADFNTADSKEIYAKQAWNTDNKLVISWYVNMGTGAGEVHLPDSDEIVESLPVENQYLVVDYNNVGGNETRISGAHKGVLPPVALANLAGLNTQTNIGDKFGVWMFGRNFLDNREPRVVWTGNAHYTAYEPSGETRELSKNVNFSNSDLGWDYDRVLLPTHALAGYVISYGNSTAYPYKKYVADVNVELVNLPVHSLRGNLLQGGISSVIHTTNINAEVSWTSTLEPYERFYLDLNNTSKMEINTLHIRLTDAQGNTHKLYGDTNLQFCIKRNYKKIAELRNERIESRERQQTMKAILETNQLVDTERQIVQNNNMR